MTILARVWKSRSEKDEKATIILKRRRFQQVLLNYGRILDLMADAADKQGGGFVLDSHYIETLFDDLFTVSKALLFDFVTICGKRHFDLFDILERLENRARGVIDSLAAENGEPSRNKDIVEAGAGGRDTEKLAADLVKYPVLYRDSGHVMSWGIASGPVFNVRTDSDIEKFPQGGIWVSTDLKQAVELSRVMGRVSAIITDTADSPGYVIRMVRSDHIPAIVGIGDATSRLKTGDVITVDADENTIYTGEIPALLEHYRSRLSSAPVDEPEYSRLRALRRDVFPLSIAGVRDRMADPEDIASVHDLVHYAHELAGEEYADMVMNARGFSELTVNPIEGKRIKAIDFDGEIAAGELSLPLASFAAGLADFEEKARNSSHGKDISLMAAMFGKHESTLIMPYQKGFDMIDASMSDNKMSNFIYCRFDSRFWNPDHGFVRRNMVLDILSRFDYAVAETSRAVSMLIRGKKTSEIEGHLRFLGRLCGFLREKDRTGFQREKVPVDIENFVSNHIPGNQ